MKQCGNMVMVEADKARKKGHRQLCQKYRTSNSTLLYPLTNCTSKPDVKSYNADEFSTLGFDVLFT